VGEVVGEALGEGAETTERGVAERAEFFLYIAVRRLSRYQSLTPMDDHTGFPQRGFVIRELSEYHVRIFPLT
jgi:hypothetical protein